jgi:flagellar basal-body rod protein FlgG
MEGQQTNIDTISNNLANVNTAGYKMQRVDFEDMLYQTVKTAGTPATEDTVIPVGVQLGSGVQVAATQRMFDQGSLQHTDNVYDMALEGEGFFRVQMYDGSTAYTRNGAFKVDSNGRMVTSEGYYMKPDITFPQGFLPQTISVNQTGLVTVKVPGQDEPVQVGQIELYRFPNPEGLQSVGSSLYKVTGASGAAVQGQPGTAGMADIEHKFLEMSNVSLVKEMVGLITAQRAYELNSRSITTSDSMLQTATQLKR